MRGLVTPGPWFLLQLARVYRSGVAPRGLPIAPSRVLAASRPGTPTSRPDAWCGKVWSGSDSGSPQEAGQLTGTGHGDHVVGLAPRAHPCVDAMDPVLGSVGDLKDVIGLALLPAGQPLSDARWASVLPGGLDQQAAGEAGAGLGDRALVVGFPGLGT